MGLVVGLVRFILEFAYLGQVPDCLTGQPDPTPAIIAKVHYLHFGIILFFIVVVVTVVISLLTAPPDRSAIINTTFATRFDFPEKSKSGISVIGASTATIPSTTETYNNDSTVSLNVGNQVMTNKDWVQ